MTKKISFEKAPRLRHEPRGKPYYVEIAPGVSLGYRRNAGPGAWVVRAADGKGGNRPDTFAIADDFAHADGVKILDYKQARKKALELAGAVDGTVPVVGDPIVTVKQAIDAYEADLTTRAVFARSAHNATAIRYHLKDSPIWNMSVGSLTSKHLSDARNAMAQKGSAPATVNRLGKSLKAALNLAAKHDRRIKNRVEWSEGWAMLPNASGDRNIILDEAVVTAIVKKAYEVSHELGVYFHILMATGTRESQMLELRVGDLQDDRATPRLMMPHSKKGKNPQIGHTPVPILPELARVLRKAAAGRSVRDKLIEKIVHPEAKFREVAKMVGGVDPEATPYALRHSSIVRMLNKGLNIRLVASLHNTSVGYIESNYSRHIADVSDSDIRKTLAVVGPELMPAQ